MPSFRIIRQRATGLSPDPRRRRCFSAHVWIPVAALVALLTGCDGLGTDSQSPEYVVESYLIAGEPIRRVLVSRTTAIDATYDFGSLAVQDADVRINKLTADGAVDETYPFQLNGLAYRPEDTTTLVEAGRRYELIVNTADGNTVRSETTVPGAFEVIGTNADSVQYQGATQIGVEVSRSQYKDRQAIFVFTIESIEPTLDSLTPFYAAFIDEEEDLDQVYTTESPPINEQNYEINPGGTLTINVPWIAVAFYGPNNVVANAVDDNLYDFLRSQSIQQGGSTFSPGEIPNVINRVEGGTGIFGSMARASVRAYFWK